jgi:hypothetical protein
VIAFFRPIQRKYDYFGVIGHEAKRFKVKSQQMRSERRKSHQFSEKTSNGGYCIHCYQPGYTKRNRYKLRNKSSRNSGTNNNDGQSHEIFSSNDVMLTTITIKIFFQVICGF